MNTDPYYLLPEISNSDLTALKQASEGSVFSGDKETAYRNGTLIDAIITEPRRVDWIMKTCDGVEASDQEFAVAKGLKRAFYNDKMCSYLAKISEFQKVSKATVTIANENSSFDLAMRCKWDMFTEKGSNPTMGIRFGCDIKSTISKTKEQFIACIDMFDWDRQIAVYCEIEKTDIMYIIGLSKINFKVFIIKVCRGDEIFNRGLRKFHDLATQHYILFGSNV